VQTIYATRPVDLADPDVGREPCDFAALVTDLPLSDVEGCLELLEAERAPFLRQRADEPANAKRNLDADFYSAVNDQLFTRRRSLQAQLARFSATAEADRAPLHSLSVYRATRAVESMTELVVRFNYGMTCKYVRRFTNCATDESADDFQGAAVVGLMVAVNSFDPGRGRFGSWAYKRIQREVLRAVRDADFANMNQHDFERRPDILRARAKLTAEGGIPAHSQVAQEAGVTAEMVTRVLNAPRIDSTNVVVGGPGSATELGDLVPDRDPGVDTQVIAAADVPTLTEHGLGALDARELYVLAARFGLDGEPAQCLTSIAAQLHLSREAVRQIERRAMSQLLHPVTLGKLVRSGR